MTTDLPSATTRIDETAGPVSAGTQCCTVLAAVPRNADNVPRLYSNAAAIYAAHGYAPGVDYCAMHISETKLPVLFVPLPIVTDGAITVQSDAGNTGTSEVVVAVGADGALDKTSGVVRIVTGGTIGTAQIVFEYSLDGGMSFKKIKLGTANSYTIPYVGLTISFGAGTLVAGDTALTWTTSAPAWDQAGITAAKSALAKQTTQSLSWLVVGDISTSTEAGYITTAANAYETTDERYVLVRAQVRAATGVETKAQWVAAMDTAMAAVVNQKRLSLGIGEAYKLSPFTGFMIPRPVSWADNVRAFQHDSHIATWKKANGPLDGWSLIDADKNLVHFDERADGGALAAGFTCFRTWGNGPNGTFIAKSLTRADINSPLALTHNMAVANIAQTVCQAEAENAVGESLILNADGTAEQTSLNAIKQRVESSLKRNILSNLRNEGKRASNVSWEPRTDDVLRTPGATLNAVLALNLRGTLEHINTTVKVNAGE